LYRHRQRLFSNLCGLAALVAQANTPLPCPRADEVPTSKSASASLPSTARRPRNRQLPTQPFVNKEAAQKFAGPDWSPWVASTKPGIDTAVKGYPNSYNRYWQWRGRGYQSRSRT